MTVLNYWKQLLATAVLILFAVAVYDYGRQQYQKGYAAAEAVFADQLQKQTETAHKASVQYEQAKADSAEKERVRYVEIQKIIRQPVYRNDCFDASGVQLINEAVAER